MGQFSWKYADTNNSHALKLYGTAYVPCPDGTMIYERCYQCYGIFGGHDIYDLVADWNREYISADLIEKPERKGWNDNEQGEKYYNAAMNWYVSQCNMLMDFVNGKPEDYMRKIYGNDWKRNIGINIAHGDKKNAALKFPIKICRRKPDCYKNIPPSKLDPYQGR